MRKEIAVDGEYRSLKEWAKCWRVHETTARRWLTEASDDGRIDMRKAKRPGLSHSLHLIPTYRISASAESVEAV